MSLVSEPSLTVGLMPRRRTAAQSPCRCPRRRTANMPTRHNTVLPVYRRAYMMRSFYACPSGAAAGSSQYHLR